MFNWLVAFAIVYLEAIIAKRFRRKVIAFCITWPLAALMNAVMNGIWQGPLTSSNRGDAEVGFAFGAVFGLLVTAVLFPLFFWYSSMKSLVSAKSE